MKKVVTLLSVPVVLLAAWGGSSWYIGQQTETALKQFIEQQNQAAVNSGFKQELVSYEKSALGAKAVTKLTMNPSPVEGLESIQFINDISNGPVFFGGGSPVQFGSARIDTRLDMDALPEDQRQWLTSAFEGKAPIEGHTVIGFGSGTTYDFSTHPLKVDQDGVQATAETIHLSGTSAADMTGKINLQAGKIEIKEQASQFTLPSLQLDGDITGMVGGQALGTFDFKAPGVSILAEGTTVPTRFDLALHSDSDVQDNQAAGKLTMQASNIQGTEDALSKLDLNVEVTGLDVTGLQAINQLQTELQSAQSQIDWNSAATETPEGQQKQQELMTKISDLSGKMAEALFGKTLKTDKSRLHTLLLAESPKGKLNADIDLTYVGQGTPDLMTLATYTPNDWGKMMKGKVLLDADKAMLPEGFDMLLTPYEQQGLLKMEGDKLKSTIELAGENVTLNGQPMAFADLLQLLVPADAGMMGEGAGDPSMGIPEDLMEKINQEGLTPEVMQLLEESDDVPNETIEIMKQLQQIQSDVQEGKMPAEQKPEEPKPN